MVIPDVVRTLFDLAVIVLGFGAIVFLHELGHFVAARWAGIRVLAFAVGIGPAIVSYRRGFGVRRGSSEPEYLELIDRAQGTAGDERDSARARLSGSVSPTEYRLNLLPLGGYVKMLGQEDLHPGATSAAADSYQSRPVWKRMVVISAGVVANIITAAILFVVVFMVGLRIEPAVIGVVAPESPAAEAVLVGAGEDAPRGLEPGDRVLSIEGDRAHDFSDIAVGAAMSRPNHPITMVVDRAGEELTFRLTPERDESSGLLTIGVGPRSSLTLYEPAKPGAWQTLRTQLEDAGYTGLEPGMTLVSAGGNSEIRSPREIIELIRASEGAPIPLVFKAEDGRESRFEITPAPELMQTRVSIGAEDQFGLQHLLGLAGVMQVSDFGEPMQGLEAGDVFVRLGELEYPNTARGIEHVRANKGRTLPAVVRRWDDAGEPSDVELDLSVSSEGTIGFYPTMTTGESTLLSAPERTLRWGEGKVEPNPALELVRGGGARVLSIDGTDVHDFASMRTALQAVAARVRDAADGETPAGDALGGDVVVPITLELPYPAQPEGGSEPIVEREWRLSPQDLERVGGLSWVANEPVLGMFENELVTDKAANPVAAISRGLAKTKRVMQQTYLTIARLFQGGVRVEHLRGPVGIAHMGTSIAERGPIWVLFFMALISVNLAVLNFLPLPIVDGGQFLMLCYEWLRGRPVPIPVQNVVTLAGLVLIGSMFLIVTYNDIARLVGG